MASRLPFPPSRLELLSEHGVRGDDPSGDSCPWDRPLQFGFSVSCFPLACPPQSKFQDRSSRPLNTCLGGRWWSVKAGRPCPVCGACSPVPTLPAPPASGGLRGPGGGASVRGQWASAVRAAGPRPGKRPLRVEGVRGTSGCLSSRWV